MSSQPKLFLQGSPIWHWMGLRLPFSLGNTGSILNLPLYLGHRTKDFPRFPAQIGEMAEVCLWSQPLIQHFHLAAQRLHATYEWTNTLRRKASQIVPLTLLYSLFFHPFIPGSLGGPKLQFLPKVLLSRLFLFGFWVSDPKLNELAN